MFNNFDPAISRQFIFKASMSRQHREQSHALSLHKALVTVTAAITYHKTNKKFYMVEADGIELIAHPDELETL
jgi:hypothetical protein